MAVGGAFCNPMIMSQSFSDPVPLAISFTSVSQSPSPLKWDEKARKLELGFPSLPPGHLGSGEKKQKPVSQALVK